MDNDSINLKDNQKTKYNIDDISIGDEVIFQSTKIQSNHDEYWTVIGKNKYQIMIELKKFGFDENWTIDINEVVGHIPISKFKK